MIELERRNSMTVVKVMGALDAFTRDALRQQIEALLQEIQPRIAIDLSEVLHLDSSGVAVLLRVWTAARGVGRELGVIQPSQHARRVLVILKMEFLLLPEALV